MFGFSKKGNEYQKLAEAFNGMFLIVKELEKKISNNTPVNLQQEIIMLAYLCRINIVDRMEKYDWDLMTSIIVPNISNSKITLLQAHTVTVDQVTSLAMKFDMPEVAQEIILDKGKLFYTVENSLPEHVRKKLNEGL